MRFYLIDKITHFESGKSGTGIKNVTLTEDFFVKHYDRTPLMPEPLIIEALAQVGGWTIAVSTQYHSVAIMLRIDNVRFYRYAIHREMQSFHPLLRYSFKLMDCVLGRLLSKRAIEMLMKIYLKFIRVFSFLRTNK